MGALHSKWPVSLTAVRRCSVRYVIGTQHTALANAKRYLLTLLSYLFVVSFFFGGFFFMCAWIEGLGAFKCLQNIYFFSVLKFWDLTYFST